MGVRAHPLPTIYFYWKIKAPTVRAVKKEREEDENIEKTKYEY